MKWTPEKRKAAYRKQQWLFTTFMDWSSSRGIKLMDEDMLHIYDMLEEIPPKLRKTCMKRYIDEWCIGKSKSDIAAHRENLGRRMANLWLREYVDSLCNKKAPEKF